MISKKAYRCCSLILSFSYFLVLGSPTQLDNSNIIAFFYGGCHLNPACTEVCVPWIRGYVCKCFQGRHLNKDGYSCNSDKSAEIVKNVKEITARIPDDAYTTLSSTTSQVLTDSLGLQRPPSLTINEKLTDVNLTTPPNTSPSLIPLFKTPNEAVDTNTINTPMDAHYTIQSYDLKNNMPSPLELSHSFIEEASVSYGSPKKNNNANSINNLFETNIDELVGLDIYSIQSCDGVRCLNGGRCRVENKVARCDCLHRYTGKTCETEVQVKFPRFHGNGHIMFPILHNAYRYFDIRLEIRPDSSDGLILFTAALLDAKTDYFSIAIIQNKIEFRFDCGTGLVSIMSERPVKIQQWNTILISRKDKNGSLKLNDEPTLYGHSLGSFTGLTIRENLYLGGHPNINLISRRVGTNQQFNGCVRKLWINSYQYDFKLSSSHGDALSALNVDECGNEVCNDIVCKNGGICIASSTNKPICMCNLGTSGRRCESNYPIHVPLFTKKSYLVVGINTTSLLNTDLEVIFKPHSTHGLILYNYVTGNRKTDLFSLRMKDGHVDFTFNLGTGQGNIRSVYPVSLDAWHVVAISRTGRLVTMMVDRQPVVEGVSEGPFTQLTLAPHLILGGYPSYDAMSKNFRASASFVGCIQKVILNNQHLDLIAEAVHGVNINNCNQNCVNLPCLNGGQCTRLHSSYTCSCPLFLTRPNCKTVATHPLTKPQFSGNSYLFYKHEEIMKRILAENVDIQLTISLDQHPSGLILWVGHTHDGESTGYLAIRLHMAKIEFRFNVGSGDVVISADLASSLKNNLRNQTYNIHARRYKSTGLLQVNDQSISEVSSYGSYTKIDTNSSLYLGGMPDVLSKTTNVFSTGFTGCIERLILGTDLSVPLIQMAEGGLNIEQCVKP